MREAELHWCWHLTGSYDNGGSFSLIKGKNRPETWGGESNGVGEEESHQQMATILHPTAGTLQVKSTGQGVTLWGSDNQKFYQLFLSRSVQSYYLLRQSLVNGVKLIRLGGLGFKPDH